MKPLNSEIESYLRRKELEKDRLAPLELSDEMKEVIRWVITRHDYYLIGKWAGNRQPKTVEAVLMGLRKNDAIWTASYDVARLKLSEMLKVLKGANKKVGSGTPIQLSFDLGIGF